MHGWAHCCDEAANHQLLTAAASWIIRIVSVEECSSLRQNLMQICCSSCSVTLNAMATPCTCSLNSVYHLPPPQTSTVKSPLFMHVHSSPLFLAASLHQCCANHSHYINNGRTLSWQTSYIWGTVQCLCENDIDYLKLGSRNYMKMGFTVLCNCLFFVFA